MKSLQILLPLACAVAWPLLAQDSDRPTIFVAPFDGDTTQMDYWQPAMGQGLSEMLTTELGKIDKFQVIESTALEHLKDEISLGDEGFVSADEKVEKGGWAGADFMFRGKVTRFGAKAQEVGLGGFVPGSLGSLGVKKSKSDVRIDWRIVDVATRKVIKTGQAVAAETGVGFKVGVDVTGHGGGIGFDNKEFMESALGKATVKALNLIVANVQTVQVPTSGRQLQKAKAQASQQAAATAGQAAQSAAAEAARSAPGKVLAVAGKGVLVISLGTQNGFKAGDKLKLYKTEDLKDDQGNVVFTEEKLVGEITLDSVQAERSKATYSGSEEVKAGWVVKAN